MDFPLTSFLLFVSFALPVCRAIFAAVAPCRSLFFLDSPATKIHPLAFSSTETVFGCALSEEVYQKDARLVDRIFCQVHSFISFSGTQSLAHHHSRLNLYHSLTLPPRTPARQSSHANESTNSSEPHLYPPKNSQCVPARFWPPLLRRPSPQSALPRSGLGYTTPR